MAQDDSNTPVMRADRAVIKLLASDDQYTTVDAGASPYAIVVTLDTVDVDEGGDYMHASGNTVVIDIPGPYRIFAYTTFGVMSRGGDRGITVCLAEDGTPDPTSDPWLAKMEIVGNNNTTRDTHAIHCSNIVNCDAGDVLWFQAWQHARAGTGTAGMTIGSDNTGEPSSYMIVERVF